MYNSYELTVDNATLVVSLADIKEHLKLDSTDNSQDAYLTSLIKSAGLLFEGYTGRDLLNKTYKCYRDCFSDEMILRRSKVSSITNIKFYIDNVLTTLSSDFYYLTNDSFWGRVCKKYGFTFPSTDMRKQAVEITFVAGYGSTPSSIPADIIIAIKNHIAFLYENRGECLEAVNGITNSIINDLPITSKLVYSKYKIEEL